MNKAIEYSLFSIITPTENTGSVGRKAKGSTKQNSKVYSSIVLEGDKLEEAIQKANELDEFEYILDALKPSSRMPV